MEYQFQIFKLSW